MKIYSRIILLVFNIGISFVLQIDAIQYVGITNLEKLGEYRIMSLNVRRDGYESAKKYKWGNRKNDVGQMLKTFKPDILGIQEAKHNQIKDIKNMLEGYSWFGKGRDAIRQGIGKKTIWIRKQGGEHTPILYNENKFEVLKKGTFWLNPSKKVGKKGWGADSLRICSWGQFKTKDKGIIFWVYNTHLDHRSNEAKKEGIKLIIKDALERTNGGREPFIVMGDLNTSSLAPDSPVGQITMEPNYLMFDARSSSPVVVGSDGTVHKGWEGKKYTIDWILINRKRFFDIRQFMVIEQVDKKISDHNAIAIDFNFSNVPKPPPAKKA